MDIKNVEKNIIETVKKAFMGYYEINEDEFNIFIQSNPKLIEKMEELFKDKMNYFNTTMKQDYVTDSLSEILQLYEYNTLETFEKISLEDN